MTPHDRALELLRLAKRDEHGAHILQADPTADVALIGFHYQQAAEKLLKALLAERNVDYPLTHDLERLLRGWSSAPAIASRSQRTNWSGSLPLP